MKRKQKITIRLKLKRSSPRQPSGAQDWRGWGDYLWHFFYRADDIGNAISGWFGGSQEQLVPAQAGGGALSQNAPMELVMPAPQPLDVRMGKLQIDNRVTVIGNGQASSQIHQIQPPSVVSDGGLAVGRP